MARRNIKQQLPQVAFAILLALSLKPRHGYEIMKQVAEDSEGKIRLGPGALYTSIKQLNEQGLIEEVAAGGDPRRRYYRLSGAGRERLAAELKYFEASIDLARSRRVLTMRPEGPVESPGRFAARMPGGRAAIPNADSYVVARPLLRVFHIPASARDKGQVEPAHA